MLGAMEYVLHSRPLLAPFTGWETVFMRERRTGDAGILSSD